MFKKFSVLLFALSLFAIAPVAHAQSETVIPEYNPLCWHEADCVAQRKILDPSATDQQLKDGWISPEGDCKGNDWGKCLPAGQTKTSIAFAGRTQFVHIGDFVGAMYKYAVGVAAIVAVMVIIVSGFQWALSGGNSETISHAKTRIVGAVIGLLIAYLSYFILNTLNPNLVSFRLPNVWMIKPQAYAPPFCTQAAPKSKFEFAKDYKDQSSPVKPKPDAKFELSLEDQSPKNLEQFYCGHRFFVQGGGTNTCFGNYCGPKTVCVGFGSTNPNNPYHCVQGTVAGRITYNSPLKDPGCINPLFNGWNFPKMVDLGEEEIWQVDENGFASEVTPATSVGQTLDDHQEYNLVVSEDTVAKSKAEFLKGGTAKLKGYLIKFEMNKSCNVNLKDENHWLGLDGSKAVDLGSDDFFDNVENRKKLDPKYFISEAALKAGIELNIDAAQVHHSSEDFKYQQYFK